MSRATSEAPSQQIRLLVNQGFEEHSAISALIAISRYTVGVVLEEQAGVRDDIDKTDNDDTFEFGLTALVDGLAAGLENLCDSSHRGVPDLLEAAGAEQGY